MVIKLNKKNPIIQDLYSKKFKPKTPKGIFKIEKNLRLKNIKII